LGGTPPEEQNAAAHHNQQNINLRALQVNRTLIFWSINDLLAWQLLFGSLPARMTPGFGHKDASA
jgi:hypothetical protein